MTIKTCSSVTTTSSALVAALRVGVLLIPLAACLAPERPGRRAAGPRVIRGRMVRRTCGWSGFNDLQGRQSLEVKAKSDAANGNWSYVGHVAERSERSSSIRRCAIEGRADSQSHHRQDGVERHLDRRDLRPGQPEARLAHSERGGTT